MTSVDDLWFLADEASQRAEQAYHALDSRHADFVEYERTRRVSRGRFRTLAERVKHCGAPFGAHTIVYRESGEVLLVRHDGVDKWVLPGGGVDGGESFREAAERELDEEAGVDADYEGLAMVTRVFVRCGDYRTWGVLPVFEACAQSVEPSIDDPDDEISAAEWFADLPSDTRDRDDLVAWRRARSL
ncbi:ADP-ribose pyrophosphatase YjhB, NUDIX family [Halogranum gelatinilyticum]|uniref:ADP-ribose pyrophosphatase YjhB, NUDIX family n=1 Tax=Halogranum gelatinilyticum TaxID=660521 RepID=A0A1H0A6J4_9EURY|nr:NUDIX domain-containing protein [Halogranum gelatinilyticum]SDN28613.1 ADP-ribose pyrophosphatase YjhB, NUDIX family [Halogranum gelatinilyticum]